MPRAATAALIAVMAISLAATARPQEISNGEVGIAAVKEDGACIGFDVRDREGTTVAVVRLSSNRRIVARDCGSREEGDRKALHLEGLVSRWRGLELGDDDSLTVTLEKTSRFPAITFNLTVAKFDAAAWKAEAGEEPFHFLALHLREAEAWHQRGWLNATPLADRFPLLEDVHVGTPEISAYKFNRNWSYTPPLGAHPIPVIGLWGPGAKRYVGLEFQTTRLGDNTEKEIATGYKWVEARDGAPEDATQFVSLVWPYGGRGYQDLVLPRVGDRIASSCRLLWSRDLPATADPNRLFWEAAAPARGELETLSAVSPVPDVSWIPGGIRLRDFQGPPPGGLIGGVEGSFQVPGSKLLGGWTWHNESPTAVAAKRGDRGRLSSLEREAEALLPYAKRFTAGGDACVFWEKPLAGEWTMEWGGKPVTTLHNANGFAAGRLFLGLWRDAGKAEYLPIVDGVFNWAKHIAWTRNEFADVPSSPFAIGGTLSASFCLEYWMAFRDSPDGPRRARAHEALDLARTFTYRYLVMWPSDNDRDDNLDSSFLWEPNSGRDWTGAACANEVFWNLDTLAQTAVHTGDPVLARALQGSLERWHLLYQEVYRDSLASYAAGDMTEGYGLFAGNVYGLGARAAYGFASPLAMCEPVGESIARVLAGEGGALAFRRGDVSVSISGYRYAHPGRLSFVVRSDQPRFDLSLTVPYVDMSDARVQLERGSERLTLEPGETLIRPPQALWSLYLEGLRDGDRVLVGQGGHPGEERPPSTRPPAPLRPAEGLEELSFPPDAAPSRSWQRLDSFAGFPAGVRWIFGVRFTDSIAEGKWAAAMPTRLTRPARDSRAVFLLYSAGDGPAPSLDAPDGSRASEGPDLEALAWRAWPPIYTSKLLVGRYAVPSGVDVAGFDPRGRVVIAATALRRDAPEAVAARIASNLERGAAEWRRAGADDRATAALRQEFEKVPEGSIALLPPKAAGPAAAFLGRLRLGKKIAALSPAELVDPLVFDAKRFRAALYAGGEDYVHTVKAAGDGADAVARYLREGGTLVVLSAGPWPFFYADGPGFHRPEPLTDRLGLPLSMAIERPPAEAFRVKAHEEAPVSGPAGESSYPEGDPRLRAIDRGRIPAGAKYAPIATVTTASGRSLGDAAGLIELPGGGRILYIAGVLLADPVGGPAYLNAGLRFLAAAASK